MVSFAEAVRLWLKIGLINFGGPAGQIATIHREVVETRKWIGEERFLRALNFCMLLPGPEATQLVTYIGWLLHGTRGGLAAGILFIFPGFLFMLLLSAVYAIYGNVPFVASLFFGLKAAVLAIVVEAVVRVGKRSLSNGRLVAVSALTFIAIFIFKISFPIVVAAAALAGMLLLQKSGAPAATEPAASAGELSLIDAFELEGKLQHTKPGKYHIPRILAFGLAIWLLPLRALLLFFAFDSVFVKLAVLMCKSALVTFGGAYAVLSYISELVVHHYHWLTTPEMTDGLGLAETTPGPLILVLQFVGFQAGFRADGGAGSLLFGILGASVAVWATFAPSFLFIFACAPYVELLQNRKSLQNALAGVSAAVVGVILNLSITFSFHALFHNLNERSYGPAHLLIPEISSIDIQAALLALFAGIVIFKYKWTIPKTLGACAVIGAAVKCFV